MLANRLGLALVLAGACLIADAVPAEAQTKPPVTITIKSGGSSFLLADAPVTEVRWTKGLLSIYGPKDANGMHKGWCVLKSTNDAMLFAIQQRVSEAKTATLVTCLGITAPGAKYQTINLDTESHLFALYVKQ